MNTHRSALIAFLSDIGPFVGIASGAVLIALAIAYVRQSRDVRRLLDWATSHSDSTHAVQSLVSVHGSPRRTRLALRSAEAAIVLLVVAVGISAMFGAGHRATEQDRLTPSERSVPVVVFNDTGAPGVGIQALRRLTRAGFEHDALGTNDPLAESQKSTVRYGPGGDAAAQDAARVLGINGNPVAGGSPASGFPIAVILGREWVHAGQAASRGSG
jgi:LytR cell envelope-related transcriptional attenuator